MKRTFTLCVALCMIITSFAQKDTTITPKPDTIRIGGIVIVRKQGNHRDGEKNPEARPYNKKKSNLTMNWLILDIGFSNYSDKTNYGSSAAQAYAPGSNKSYFNLKDGRSRNINFWLFMQKLNVVKHVFNLKYGFGLELNNYHFDQDIRFQKNALAIPAPPRVIMDVTPNRNYEKNKLAADYVTIPMMANFNFTPKRRKGFGFSAGISAGYLYSARNKTVTSDEGKEKNKDDFRTGKVENLLYRRAFAWSDPLLRFVCG